MSPASALPRSTGRARLVLAAVSAAVLAAATTPSTAAPLAPQGCSRYPNERGGQDITCPAGIRLGRVLTGTPGDDTITITGYAIPATVQGTVDGGGGNDTILLIGTCSRQLDTAACMPVISSKGAVTATGASTITVYGANANGVVPDRSSPFSLGAGNQGTITGDAQTTVTIVAGAGTGTNKGAGLPGGIANDGGKITAGHITLLGGAGGPTTAEGTVGGAGGDGNRNGTLTLVGDDADASVTGGNGGTGTGTPGAAGNGNGDGGTITGGPGTNTIRAAAGTGAEGTGAANTGTIDGNMPPATSSTCTLTGADTGTVKNCTLAR